MLHIINSLSSGGAEKMLRDIVPLQQSVHGTEVDIIVLSTKNKVFDIPSVRIITPGVGIYSIKNVFFIRTYLSRYDIVHAHLFPTQYFVAIASLFLKDCAKLIFSEHNTHNNRRRYRFYRPLETWIYKRYDAVVSVSNGVEKSLKAWVPKGLKKSLVIDNGVDIASFIKALPYKKTELHENVSTDDVLLMMVARFSPAKDQKTLVRALAMLPDHYKLMLVGEGSQKNDIQILATQMNVSHRVIFMGFRSDIPRLVKSVDINVLSTHWEGFGLTCVEGMLSGKPFLASDVDCVREIVSGAGILFERENERDFADKVLKLMNDRAYYDNISNQCLQRAKQYDIASTVYKYDKLYLNLVTEI